MGYFSWMYADTDNKENLKVGGSAYVPCPDGSVLYEDDYDGYGIFQGKDIYELVVWWNHEYLSTDLLKKPSRSSYVDDEEGRKSYLDALSRYEESCRLLEAIRSCASLDEFTALCHGDADKAHKAVRRIGIELACDDTHNAALKFPIKICKKKRMYFEAGPSDDDPAQGWFY